MRHHAHSALLGLPIVLQEDSSMLARVLDLFLNPDNGQVIAIRTGWNLGLAPSDLTHIGHHYLAINDPELFMPLSDFQRLQDHGLKACRFIGKTVVYASGQKAGKVVDFTIDASLRQLLNFQVVRSRFFRILDDRLFTWNHIDHVTDSTIFLNIDPEETVTEKQVQEAVVLA